MDNGNMTLVGHLEELRKMIIKIILSLFIVFILVYINSEKILSFVLRPSKDIQFIYTKPEELLVSYLKIFIAASLVISIPLIFYHIWKFIRPAFTREEKKFARKILLLIILQIYIGLIFSYYVMLPISLKFLLNFSTSNIRPLITVENYLSFLINISLTIVLIFQLPIIVIILTKLKILTSYRMSQYKKYIIFVIFIIAAVMTPPDVISQLIIALPMILLYEISYKICVFMERRNDKE
ncbi:MAG: twin-arginine translocase subunit TatC [Finegoldia sp.]|nr:twin-arginine translocase subunit TatC [Finegoldia sp.]